MDHLRTFLLPHRFGGPREIFTASFTATGSIQDELHERDPALRAPLLRRLYSVLISDLGIVHLTIALGYVGGVCLNFYRAYSLHGESVTAMGVFLLTRVFWVGAAWPYAIVCFLRPLQNALFPPNAKEREDLLVRDRNGLAYPREDARGVQYTGVGLGEILYVFSVIHAAGSFVASYLI